VLLSEYDVKYMTQKSIKGSAIVEYLALNPLEEYQPWDFKFQDEDILTIEKDKEEGNGKWKMFFDSASNMHGNGVGAIIISPERKQFPWQ